MRPSVHLISSRDVYELHDECHSVSHCLYQRYTFLWLPKRPYRISDDVAALLKKAIENSTVLARIFSPSPAINFNCYRHRRRRPLLMLFLLSSC